MEASRARHRTEPGTRKRRDGQARAGQRGFPASAEVPSRPRPSRVEHDHERARPGGPGAQVVPADHPGPQDRQAAHQPRGPGGARRATLAGRPYGPVSWVHNARAAGRVTLTRRVTPVNTPSARLLPKRPGPSSSDTSASLQPPDGISWRPRTPQWRISSPRQTATLYSSSHQSMRIARLASLHPDRADVACCGTK